MLAELYVLTGRDAGKLIDAVGPTIYLGRAATNHYRIRDPQASRVHCRIDITTDGLTLQDEGSGNGTFVNEEPLEGSRELADGDEIRVGTTRLKVLIETPEDHLEGSGSFEASAEEASSVADVPRDDAASASGHADRPGAALALGASPDPDAPRGGSGRSQRRRRGLREVLPGYSLRKRLGGHSHQGIAVYRASQRSLDRPVALKVFLPRGPSLKDDVDRFLREARAIARLPHPNVVTIHDVITRGKMHVIVMEFLAGGSLADRLEGGRALEALEVLHVGEGIASALAYLHGQGVLHRNITPGSILLAPELQLYKLGGFGLATGPTVERQGDTCFLANPKDGTGFLAP
jgi:pSer/pThr/pTyr-binding forkhead associated (FHA) protein